ncbi:MAG: ABC transporter substrate-binding protein [Roseiflexaceae bacterium]|nr:ABC transporter substrate-binding protein [Roseiflexaceae bacterium]
MAASPTLLWCARLVKLVCALALSGCAAVPRGVLDTGTDFAQDALTELPAAPSYRIGIQTEVTGSGAQIGDLSIRAARLAIEQINASGGIDGVPLELVVRDCRSDVATALAEYHAAVESDQLVALLGPVKSAYAVPMVQEHLGDTLPLFIGATSTTLTEQGDQNLFQMRPSIKVTAAAMVAFAAERLGTARAGIIYDADLHGSNGALHLAEALRQHQLDIVTEIAYTTATVDYDPLARQVAAAKLDTIFIYGTNPTDIGLLLRALRYRVPNATIVTSPGGSSVTTHNLAGDAQDGIYVAVDSQLSGSNDGARFEQAFRDRFGLAPDTYVIWYYDAVYLLAETLRAQQGDPTALGEALRGTSHQGAQGRYHFNAQGEGLHSVVLASMSGGAPRLIGMFDERGFRAMPAASATVELP